MTSGDEKSKTSANSVVMEVDPETIRPNIAMEDMKNKHGSSLHNIPVEETSFEKAGRDVGKCIEENTSIPCKEASKETFELNEKMKDTTSIQDEDLNKNLESSFAENVEDVLFRKVDNLETSPKETEYGRKDIVKESQYETSTHEEQLEQRHMPKTVGKPPMDSKEIETEGSNKHAETITNIEDQRTDGIPGEIVGEKGKDETIIVDDFDKEIQEAKNFPTIDLDEKTRSGEFEIPNKSGGGELFVTHSPIEEEIQVGGENEDEVSMSLSDDRHKIIQNPNKEKKCVDETFEATKSPESTISEHAAIEEALNVGAISISAMGVNIEKGCELNSEEELKKIRAEENVEEEREQIEKASNAKFSVERKSDDNEGSTVHEGILVKNKTPLCSKEEYHHDQEEKVGSNSFQEECTETVSGNQIGVISEKIDNINEIINREVCEDLNIADRSEYIEKDMKDEESTVTDCSPKPAGEYTTNCSQLQGNQTEEKKQTTEVSDGYDTYIASTTLRERDITDLRSSYVQEEEAEESLKADRRDAGISDKEVWSSHIEQRELDFDATYCMKEKIAKDLKVEAKAGWNTQNIAGSSEAEAAQKEGNINLVQNTSAPELIEKEIEIDILKKEADPKDMMEAEETRLTEAEAEFPIRVNSSNLISEEKGQVSETSEMVSIGTDIIAEPAEISILGDNKDMEIPAERKDGSNEATEKTQTESKNETCHELSESEDQREIATVETSFGDITEQDLLESSTIKLEAHNLVTEVTGEAPERGKNLYAREEIPSVAETTEKYIAVKEGESENQKIDTNTGSIGTGKERTIDDDWVEDRELHVPLVLNNGKSISGTDVKLLKGVNAGEAANDSEIDKLDTSEDEKSSYIGVEKDKIEYREAVDEASEGVEVGGGCIVTENAILEQEDSAKNFESSSKEGVESEPQSCGNEASEIQTISTKTETKRDVDDTELTSELPKKNAESWLSQPPETIEILETECMQEAHHLEVGKVNTADKENVETIEGESSLKSISFDDGKLTKNTEDDEFNTKAEMSGFQEEEKEETGKLSDRMKDDASIKNEVQNQNLESLFVKEVENLETSKEQSETRMSIDNETQKEAENQNQTLENTTTSNLSAENEDVEIQKRKARVSAMKMEESTTGDTEDVTSAEALTVECEPGVMVVAGADYVVVNEQETTEKSKQDQHSEQSFKQNTEPANANMGSPSTVASEDFKTTSLKDCAERISNINEERPIRTPEQILGKTIIAVGINENEITETKNLSTVDVGEKTRSAEVKIPNNISNQVHITHSPVENLFPDRDETQNDVSMLESEEQDRNETSEHEEHSKQSLVQDTETAKANLGRPSIVASEIETTSHNEYGDSISNNQEARTDGSPEEILGETRNDETMIADDINSKELPEAESLSAVDLEEENRSADVKILDDKNRSTQVEIPNNGDEVCVRHPPKEETVLEGREKQNEVSMLELADQVHEASVSEVPKGEEKHANDSCETSKSPECKLLEHTSTEGAINVEVTSTGSTKETPVGSQEEILGETRKDETMIADDINCEQLPEAEGLSAVNLDEKNRSAEVKIPNNGDEVCVSHPPMEEKILEGGKMQNEVYMLELADQVHEASASEFPKDEEKHANDSYEASKSPECKLLEHTSTEGEINVEVTQTRSPKETPNGSQDEILVETRKDETMIPDYISNKETPEAEIREELETTSENKGIESQAQAKGNRVQGLSAISSTKEQGGESSKDDLMITKPSTQEVLRTNPGGQDTDELLKSLATSSNIGSRQTTKISDADQHEIEETSSIMSQFPLNECEKSENVSANADKSDTYDVEVKEFEIAGTIPEHKNLRIQEIDETGTCLPEEEAHTNEIENQIKGLSEAFSEGINHCVEAVSEDEINASVVTREVTRLWEVQLNEHTEALDIHSSAQHLNTIKTADAGQQDAEFENMKHEETCIMVSQLTMHKHEEADNENIPVEKSRKNVEVVETKISDSVPEAEDQAVKEIHETGTSRDLGDADTDEIENPIREVLEELSEHINEGFHAARDDETTSGQTLRGELEEQHQAPSYGLLSKEKESGTTTTDQTGSTNKDGINGTKILQAEVLETNLGGQDADEIVKSLLTSSNTGSQQTTKTYDAMQHELQETSSMMSQFPLNEHEKSENISANLDKLDTYDVEVKEFETPGAVPVLKDPRVREFHDTDTSLPEKEEEEAHTNEIENQNREVPEALSEEINQCVETVSEDEIIAPAVAREETSLGEVRLNEHVEVLDLHSSTKHLDTIKISDASQHDAEIENMKLEETRLVVSQLPIHEQEETENENILVKKSEENDNEVEETKIPDTLPEFEDQAVKEIHETGKNLNVGGTDTNEIENPIKELPEALSERIKQYVDVAGDNEIASGQTLQGEKLEERLQASSSGLLPTERESETTTTNEQGSADKESIEGTKILQVEIAEDLETTSEGKEIENQVQEGEKIVQDWSKIRSAEELNTKSSKDNAMTKTSREVVLETNQGGHDTGEHVKALDTSSETESPEKPDACKEELEETSSMVYKLPVHEYEKADNNSVTVDKPDACAVEVKETELPGVEPESKDQRIKEVHEAGTRVEQTQTMEIETQIREVREALSEVVNQGPEAVSEDEIIGASAATKVTNLVELGLNDEKVETPDTVKTAYDNQQDAQFESKKCEVTSIIMSQLPLHEDEKAESENIPAEKSDENDVEVGETEFTDKVPESEDHAVKEIHETGRSLTEGEADINKIEKQIREVPEASSEPTNSCFNTYRIDEMTPVQTLRAENVKEQLQVPSSDLLSKEGDGETSLGIEMGCTDKDGTEIGRLRLQEDSGTVFQLRTTEFDSAKNVVEEKSDADEVELNKTRTYGAVSKSENWGFEVIPEIRASPAAENTETDKIKEHIKEETEKIVYLTYQGVDAATDGEKLYHPLPVGKSEEHIQLSSSSYESTKEDETELNNSELEEATGTMPRFPTIESEILYMSATIKMSEADEVQIGEDKTSEAISDSTWDNVEEIKKIGSNTLVGNTRTDEDKEETKAVPETIFEPTCQGTETATDWDIAINQTLTTGGVQLEESKRTTEPPCLQEEGRREFEVSNLELKVQDIQDRSPEEENTGLEKGATDAPSKYETRPIKDSSQDSNKDADNLPPSYPTVTKLSTEDVSRKCEADCNLWFEKDGTSEEMQGAINFGPISLQEDTSTMTVQGDELRAEDHPGQIKDIIFEAPRNEIQNEMVFEKSEEAGVKKNTEEALTADDKGPYQVSVACQIPNVTKNTEESATNDDKGPCEVSVRHEITNVTPREAAKDVQNIQKTPYQSEPKSRSDEADIADTETEANAHIKELNSTEVMPVSCKEEITGNNNNKDGQLQKTDLAVAQVTDAAAEEAPDRKEVEIFDHISEPAPRGPTHEIIEPYEHQKEYGRACPINSESLKDNEKLRTTTLEPACEGSGGTEDQDQNKKDGTNEGISSTTATLQETMANKECQKTVDTKQHDFISVKPTAEAISPKEGNSFQLGEHTKDKETVELSIEGNERKLDEAKIQTITAIEKEKTQQENEKSIDLPHIMDLEKGISHEEVMMNTSEGIHGLEKKPLPIPHVKIASKTDPNESIERTNLTANKDVPLLKYDVDVGDLSFVHALGSEPEAKGMECGEDNRMGEELESAKMSLSDLLQRSTKRNLQVVEDSIEEIEAMANRDNPQNEGAETAQAEEAVGMHGKKDEEEEGDELRKEDSGSDAPVMIEASRDMDVKIAHKKSHHLLSGVGSKVKHSLSKVKKAITGKPPSKPTSPK